MTHLLLKVTLQEQRRWWSYMQILAEKNAVGEVLGLQLLQNGTPRKQRKEVWHALHAKVISPRLLQVFADNLGTDLESCIPSNATGWHKAYCLADRHRKLPAGQSASRQCSLERLMLVQAPCTRCWHYESIKIGYHLIPESLRPRGASSHNLKSPTKTRSGYSSLLQHDSTACHDHVHPYDIHAIPSRATLDEQAR